jgi:glycosyltransferase 2 family protein
VETLGKLRNKILFSVVIGAVVVLVLGVVGDIEEVGAQIGRFRWSLVPAIVGLIVMNYSLRWLKWDYYLRRLRMGQGVSRGESALIFLAGMVMAITPGKVGEVLKSALLKQVNGTPLSASAPIVLAERITDGLAMLLLMGLGLSLYAPARLAFVALVALSALAIGIAQNRALSLRLIGWAERLPVVGRFGQHLQRFYESSALLLSWRVLLVSTLISFVSWGGECLAFYVILVGLGEPGSLLLLQQATFIYAASTLFGLISFLPGGLGVSEASSATLLGTLIGMPRAAAVAATIFIRLCTLWFGVSLGIVALLLFTHRHGASNGAADLPAETA